MTPARMFPSIALVGVLLAGCSSPINTAETKGAVPDEAYDPVIIALIDSGTLPYISAFWVDDDTGPRQAIPGWVESLEFSKEGTVKDRILDSDRAMWASTKPEMLYHFAGTRLFGISFDTEWKGGYTRDNADHGAETSYFAARDAPDAIIVSVQVSGRRCVDGVQCVTGLGPSAADGMEWVADQPWIDIVSLSMGQSGNPPDRPEWDPDMARFVAASERAAASGKIFVVGSGNTFVPPLAAYEAGPPWVIAVGGVERNASGEAYETSRAVDVVANFSDLAPDGQDLEMQWQSGTSYATPMVAGTLANALAKIRAADPARVTTTQELRDALNASAVYFQATDWDPRPTTRDGLPNDLLYGGLPILLQPQMGWGYVNASLADAIAQRVLAQDFSIPAEKDQAKVFQPAWQSAREEFWARWRT